MSAQSNDGPSAARKRARSTVTELLLAGSDLGHLLDRMLRQRADLTPVQFNALRLLKGREPEAAQPSDLTRGLRLSSAHATTVLQQLEARGLLERVEGADRRRRPVRLTNAGQEVLATTLPILAELEERLAARIGSEESAELWGQLRAVRMAVHEAISTDDLDCVGP